MAAAYRSSDGTYNASSNSNTVTKPSSTADGDLMLALVYINDSTATITPPAGWNLLETNNTPQSAKSSLYWKIASSEGASWTWSFSSTARNRASVHSFTGIDGSVPYSGHGNNGVADGDAISPSIWSGVPDSLLVYLVNQDSALTSSWTAPGGMTERYDTNGASSHGVFTQTLTSEGMSGVLTAVPSDGTDQSTVFLVSLIPSGYSTTYPIIQNVYSSHNTGSTTLTIPVNVPTFLTNTYLSVGVVIEDESITNAVVSSITHNGDAVTKIDEIQAYDTVGTDYETSSLWARAAPDTGDANVVITIGGSVAATVIGGVVYVMMNCSQSSQPNASNKAESSGAIPITVDVISTVNNCLILDNVDDGLSTDTPTVGANQIQILNYATGVGELMHLSSIEKRASAGTITMSWTNGDATKAWSTVSAAFKTALNTTTITGLSSVTGVSTMVI